MTMTKCVILGLQYGDEGKGRVIDWLLSKEPKKKKVCIRFNGGNNAGHTVNIKNQKFILHSIPVGALHKNTINIIGRGCVLNAEEYKKEKKMLENAGVYPTIYIDKEIHLITEEHLRQDREENQRLGTTMRGIGPCYAGKVARKNDKSLALGLEECVSVPKILENLDRRGYDFYYEGAQGYGLDIDSGDYPYVTSSNTTIGACYTGTGYFTNISSRYGVFKAYSTRVGKGYLSAEIANEKFCDFFREKAGEFGATTGRPRRIAWLDIPSLKRAIRANGINRLVMTKLDCLSDLEIVKARDKFGHMRTFEGWDSSWIPNSNDFNNKDKKLTLSKLSEELRTYLRFIEEEVGQNIKYISYGPNREDIAKFSET